MQLKLLDLFSGIGGFSLGLESTGYFKTIAFVEKDKFCQQVLKKNFKDIPIESEVRNVKGSKYKADIITGGFPCQPFSVAGKRRGTDDDRYLWDETIRVIREAKPRWFIGENVEGIINIQEGMVLRQVQDDLEKEGFQVQCLVIPASGIGAWHQRKRVWIIANSKHNGSHRSKGNETIESSNEQKEWLSVGDDKNISKSESLRNGGWSSEQCGFEGWNFQQSKQKGSEIWSKAEGCYSHLISNTDSQGLQGLWDAYELQQARKKENTNWSSNDEPSQDVRNSSSTRRESSINRQRKGKIWGASEPRSQCKETWWQTQSRICGVPDGISFELDKNRNNRIKSLGNSIVPLIARELGLAIMKAEQDG